MGALLDAGAVGINLEDGTGSPELLVEKLAAVRAAGLAAMPAGGQAAWDAVLDYMASSAAATSA